MKSLRGLVKCPNFTFILLGRSKAKDEGLRNFKSFRFTFGKFSRFIRSLQTGHEGTKLNNESATGGHFPFGKNGLYQIGFWLHLYHFRIYIDISHIAIMTCINL